MRVNVTIEVQAGWENSDVVFSRCIAMDGLSASGECVGAKARIFQVLSTESVNDSMRRAVDQRIKDEYEAGGGEVQHA